MKKLFFLAAAAALALASCTQSDELATSPGALSTITQDDNAVRFGTYLSETATRAGEAVEGDIISTDVLKGTAYTNKSTTVLGFGVFAVHNQTTVFNNIVDRTPNFMYNERVYWDNTNSGWKYDLVKYWPNGKAAGTGNADDKNAEASEQNYVSFFAYAPYIASTAGTTYGITGMSAANAKTNPTISYELDLAHFVDLLWGTANTSDVTVTGVAQNGGGVTTTTDGSAITTGQTNKGDVNIDLTKQKVNGQVKFNFKHALARIGGPAVDGSNPNNSGFRVKLDIDNSTSGLVAVSPAITGGTREHFTVSTTDDAWRTKVTIKDIVITNDLDESSDIGTGEVGQYITGDFDLARGEWTPTGSTGVMTKDLGTSTSTTPDKTYSAELNTKLAEGYDNSGTWATWISKAAYSTVSSYFLTSEDTNHPGVTEDFQNVYNDASANPLTLIPGTTPKFKVTVTYVVRTYDEKLATKYTEVTQTISKVIAFTSPIELNKRYNIDMHLGLTSVKFDATVSDWATGTVSDGDGDSNQDNDIYLPINVLPAP